MRQALIGPASDLLGGRLKSKAETKAAETRAKVPKAEAEAEVMKVGKVHRRKHQDFDGNSCLSQKLRLFGDARRACSF